MKIKNYINYNLINNIIHIIEYFLKQHKNVIRITFIGICFLKKYIKLAGLNTYVARSDWQYSQASDAVTRK